MDNRKLLLLAGPVLLLIAMRLAGCSGSEPSPHPDLQELHAALGFTDRDQDGTIECSSWRNLWLADENYKPEADINGDGQIVPAEAKYYLHSMEDADDETRRRHALTEHDKALIRELLTARLDSANALKYPSDRVRAISSIASTMARAGFPKNETTDLFRNALSIVSGDGYGRWDGHRRIWRDTQTIVAAMVEAGLFEEALTIASPTAGPEYPLGALRGPCLAHIATELARVGRFQDALNTADMIHDPRRRSSTLCDVASSMFEAGTDREDVMNTFRGALRAACTIECVTTSYEQKQAIREIVAAIVRAGFRKQEAFREAFDAAHPTYVSWTPYTVDSVCSVVAVMAKAGLTQGQMKLLFGTALDVLDPIDETSEYDKQRKRSAMCFVVEAMARVALFHESLEVLDTIEPSYEKYDTFRGVAKLMAEAGLFKEALEVAHRIPDNYLRADALSDIAKKMAEAGLLQEALEIARTISLDAPHAKIQALEDVAVQISRAGADSVQVIGVFEEAVQVVRLSQTEYYNFRKADMFWEIAEAMAEIRLDPQRVRAVRNLGDSADALDWRDESEKRAWRIKMPDLSTLFDE